MAEFYAILTALCWGIGSMIEKRGVIIGGFAPIMGTTLRTSFSLLLLLLLSHPHWSQIKTAGIRSVSFIALGGGVLAGGLGIAFLYTGLKYGHLSTVMTVAFCLAPVIGVVLGFVFLQEKLAPVQILGICLCVSGAALVTYFRN